MNTRFLMLALPLIVVATAVLAIVEVVYVPSARAEIQACTGADECARAWDRRHFVFQVELLFSGIMGVGAMLLLPGLILDNPLPASVIRRVESPVSWTVRGWNLGPEIRIPLLFAPLAVISIASLNPIVVGVSLAVFAAPLVWRRRSLSPRMIHGSFLLALGATVYLVGFALGGFLGVICAAALVLTAGSVLFLTLPKL